MSLRDYILTAKSHMRQYKLRSTLTILGIVIGIASIIAVSCVGSGGEKRIENEFNKLGINRVVIYSTDAKSLLSTEDAKWISATVPNVSSVSSCIYGIGKAAVQDKSLDITCRGVEQNLLEIESLLLQDGRFFYSYDVSCSASNAVICSRTAEKLFGETRAIGKRIIINNKSYTVIGVVNRSDYVSEEGAAAYQCYLPLTTFQKVFNINAVNEVSVSFEEGTDLDSSAEMIMKTLEIKKGPSDSIKTTNLSGEKKLANEILNTFSLVLSVIGIISLLVAGIGVMNIMLVSVKERTLEIGIRKAIGATNFQILMQILVESVIHTLIGGMAGILLGLAISWAGSSYINIPFSVTPETILGATIFSAVIGVASGVYPAYTAARLQPTEAFRER